MSAHCMSNLCMNLKKNTTEKKTKEKLKRKKKSIVIMEKTQKKALVAWKCVCVRKNCGNSA